MDDKDIIVQPSAKITLEEAIASYYDFDITNIIAESFTATSGLKLKFFWALLICLAISFVLLMIEFIIFGDNGNTVYQIVSNLFIALMLSGFFVMSLNWLRDGKVRVTDIFSGFKKPLTILLASIVMIILISLGFLLLIIPGIYLAISYVFVYFIIADNHNVSFWTALEASRKITLTHWFKIFALNVIFALILLLALIPLGLGGTLIIDDLHNTTIKILVFLVSLTPFIIAVIWVFPAAILAHGIIYRKIFDITDVAITDDIFVINEESNQDIIY